MEEHQILIDNDPANGVLTAPTATQDGETEGSSESKYCRATRRRLGRLSVEFIECGKHITCSVALAVPFLLQSIDARAQCLPPLGGLVINAVDVDGGVDPTGLAESTESESGLNFSGDFLFVYGATGATSNVELEHNVLTGWNTSSCGAETVIYQAATRQGYPLPPWITVTFSAPKSVVLSDSSVGLVEHVAYSLQPNTTGASRSAIVSVVSSYYWTGSQESGQSYTWLEINQGVTISPLVINAPLNGAVVALDSNDYTQTSPISFQATASNSKTPINWKGTLTYTTSGGVGPFLGAPLSFKTSSGAASQQSLLSEGGMLTVTAEQSGEGSAVNLYTPGSTNGIPNSEITSLLTSLYTANHSGIAGYTPDLLCHIAVQESAYRQFLTESLFGVSAKWPIENPPVLNIKTGAPQVKAGAYIGLLQAKVSMGVAFDWKQNAQSGLDILNGHLSTVLSYQSAEQAAYPSLPAMEGDQIEESALVIYGGFANRDPVTCKKISGALHYWVPAGGTAWALNPAADCKSAQGNTAEDYVNGVILGTIPQ